jgi:hypothetical protein
MKSLSKFTYNQRYVIARLTIDIIVLAVFLIYELFGNASRNLTPVFAVLSWVLFPTIYMMVSSVRNMHIVRSDVDERDSRIEAEGSRDGYMIISLGIYMILFVSGKSIRFKLDELFFFWILSRIVANGKKLRLYAGHISWLPDSFFNWYERGTVRRLERLRRLTGRKPRTIGFYVQGEQRDEKK